ncbi:alpha/beta hydrolase [Paenibacillus chartarius]|uniref:Alpha/beta hydrolase n=1 Tax=Paenibacillus chartarius TaxID=747481 RepID=A0ABV6DKL1_9BACL
MFAALWGIGALGVAAAVGTAAYSAAVGWKLTHPVRKPVTASPSDMDLSYSCVRFPSRGGEETLDGWWIPAAAGTKPKATVIFSHGYAGNRLEEGLPALALAAALVKADCNVLMYDFRNSGQSTGTLTSVGYHEHKDVLGAVDWALQQGADRIVLLGFSMGATSSLLAAAKEPAVAAVIADSPFSHLTRYLRRNLPVWTRLPNFPFTPLILTILPLLTGTKPDEVDAEAAVERIYPRPVLFVHSERDGAIPSSNSAELAARHPDRFELWLTDDGTHVGSYRADPDAYTKRILAFLERVRPD